MHSFYRQIRLFENRNFADSDWLTYLLFGKDISVPDNSGEYLGYEMGKGSGISTKEGNTITTAVDPSTNLSKKKDTTLPGFRATSIRSKSTATTNNADTSCPTTSINAL